MCESTEILVCEKCQASEVHLISGSGLKATCLGCGDEKRISLKSLYCSNQNQGQKRNYNLGVIDLNKKEQNQTKTINHGDRERRV